MNSMGVRCILPDHAFQENQLPARSEEVRDRGCERASIVVAAVAVGEGGGQECRRSTTAGVAGKDRQ